MAGVSVGEEEEETEEETEEAAAGVVAGAVEVQEQNRRLYGGKADRAVELHWVSLRTC